jgi:hypothetical protein
MRPILLAALLVTAGCVEDTDATIVPDTSPDIVPEAGPPDAPVVVADAQPADASHDLAACAAHGISAEDCAICGDIETAPYSICVDSCIIPPLDCPTPPECMDACYWHYCWSCEEHTGLWNKPSLDCFCPEIDAGPR